MIVFSDTNLTSTLFWTNSVTSTGMTSYDVALAPPNPVLERLRTHPAIERLRRLLPTRRAEEDFLAAWRRRSEVGLELRARPYPAPPRRPALTPPSLPSAWPVAISAYRGRSGSIGAISRSLRP